jgi:hypothetical protein
MPDRPHAIAADTARKLRRVQYSHRCAIFEQLFRSLS